jgi:hypothetical protein
MALTPEQIEEALKSKAVKDAIKDAVDDEVKGLKNKNSELLASIRELKDSIKEIEDAKEKELEKIAAKSGDVEGVKKQLEEKHAKELAKRDEQLTKLTGQLQTHVIDQGLTASLTKAKVKPELVEAAKALIMQQFKGEVGDNDGKPFAKFDGKTVDDFVTGWGQTESGKHFISADKNNGGGSNGANGSGQGSNGNDGKKTMTRKDFDALGPADRMKVSKEGVSLTD